MTRIANNGLPDRRYRKTMNTYFISCEDCGTEFRIESESLKACEEAFDIYKNNMHKGHVVHVEKNIGFITLARDQDDTD